MKRDKRRMLRYRVQAQWTVLLVLFTAVTTFVTGWILYGRMSDQVIRGAWQQHEALLDSACTALDQQIDQMRSFTWQLNTDTDVQRYLYLKEQTPRDILAKTGIITLTDGFHQRVYGKTRGTGSERFSVDSGSISVSWI